jgi:hypothetical protein
MGLDIFIRTDKDSAIRVPEYYSIQHNYRDRHSLSRFFCNFMWRRNEISGEPELDQIGRMTGVDIQPFYEMETFSFDDDSPGSDTDGTMPGKIIENLDKVLTTVNTLIAKLSVIDNLPELLHTRDTTL